MPHFVITGGVPLTGKVRCSGSKNAALPIMAAAILASEPVRLENVPRLSDVQTQFEVLHELGVRAAWRGAETPTQSVTIETVDCRPVRAPEALVRRMRASFCVLGPLLARRRRALVPLPGGCNIGNRPVDLHLKGLAALGADIRLKQGYVVAEARRLVGADIDMSGRCGPTVTGTANVMSAAVLARGVTVLRGAAIEPEVVDLGRFLIALGAKITGLGTPTIRIEGVQELGGARHTLIPDRIEAATLLIAVAMTAGNATVAGASPHHLEHVLAKLSEAGASIDVGVDRISVAAQGRLRAVELVAQAYPGVPTDVQAQWTALAAISDGISRVQDRVFPGRFRHVAELIRLGAKIDGLGDTAVIRGVPKLSGANVTASDLRASAALVLAGLAAEGRTTVGNIHHLDRGYESLDLKLRQLGASIERHAVTKSMPTDAAA